MGATKKRRAKKFSKVEVSVLNITTMPHSAERYRRLIRSCYERTVAVPFRGSRHAMIGLISNTKVDGISMVAGEILTYDEVGKRWLDVKTREEAKAEDIKRIDIPPHLRPNFESYQFLLNPESHRLAFDAKLGPANAARIFERMFEDEWVVGEFGSVDVTLIQESEGLKRIFDIPELQKLSIHLARPNPDDLEGYEEDVRRRLQSNHAGTLELEYAARPGESLTPDKETRAYAEVALSNGYVKAKGKTRDGVTINESTKSHPQTHVHAYTDDDGRKTIVDRFREAARAIIGQRVIRRGKRDG